MQCEAYDCMLMGGFGMDDFHTRTRYLKQAETW